MSGFGHSLSHQLYFRNTCFFFNTLISVCDTPFHPSVLLWEFVASCLFFFIEILLDCGKHHVIREIYFVSQKFNFTFAHQRSHVAFQCRLQSQETSEHL